MLLKDLYKTAYAQLNVYIYIYWEERQHKVNENRKYNVLKIHML